jgi:NAD/NADP transhydrogenase beta subunit
MSKVSIFVEFLQFLRYRKKWWLIPVVVVLVLLGLLLVLSEGSALAPFIYTIF